MQRTAHGQHDKAPLYSWYVVAVLTLVYLFSFMDRQILSLLIEPIRADLGISDTQISLLGGIAFALCHSTAALPLGRLADAWSRKGVIIAGATVWCSLTAVCGLAQNFWQMFAARMGVGVGEAALSPAAYAMIQDYFPPRQFATAMGVFVVGAPLGVGSALLVGGVFAELLSGIPPISVPLLGQLAPWQTIFIAIGLLGFVTVLLMATVKEPRRKGLIALPDSPPAHAALPVSEIKVFLTLNRALFAPYLSGLALLNVFNYGVLIWCPTLMVRKFEWTIAQSGMRLGLLMLVLGTLAPICAARYVNMLQKRGRADAALAGVLLGAALVLPFAIAAPLVDTQWLAFALFGPVFFFIFFVAGVVPTSILVVTPNQMRSQISAVYLFIVNTIGVGLGPTAFAFATDFVFGRDSALPYSMALVSTLTIGAGVLLIFISRPAYRASVQRAQQWET